MKLVYVVNDYTAVPNLIPQRKEDCKWVTLKMNSPNPLNTGEKLYNQFDIKESFGNKKGTYRFRVDAMTSRATMLKRLVCSTLANFILNNI